MQLRQIAALSLIGLLAACASAPVAISVQPLAGNGAYPAQAYIQVLESRPSTSYVPVARLVATGSAGLAEPQVLAALEDKARELGANALIVRNETTRTQPSLTYSPSGGQYAVSAPTPVPKYVGLAIHLPKAQSSGSQSRDCAAEGCGSKQSK